MDTVTYDIPVSQLDAYRGRRVIVRSRTPSEFQEHLSAQDLKTVSYLRLLSPDADMNSLMQWGNGLPLDIVMADPATEFPLLYCLAPLLDKHPVRISVPVVPGFGKAVKLAASLHFVVNLMVGQPAPELHDEMVAALMLYLRDSTVSHPIEYFHSMFFAFYHEAPVTLWEIQEKDPAYFRYITDQGEETMNGYPPETRPEGDLSAFPEHFIADFSEEENGECAGCEFFTNCCGYFKWPRRDFRCDTMKHLFRILKDAAAELKKDETAFLETHGGNRL